MAMRGVRFFYVNCIRRNKKAPANYLPGLLNEWELLDSNQRPPACKAGALNQLS